MRGVPDEERIRYERRTRRSLRASNRSKTITPYGVHSNYRFYDPYPIYCNRARGTSIWDVDGNRYLDFNMGYGALVTGHAHPLLVEAIGHRLKNGTLFGFETDEAYDLGKLISLRFGLDMVRFSSTGLEGTMHAVRLAKAFTGRRKILKFEGCYHGSHDAVLVSVKPTRRRAGNPRHPEQVPSSSGLNQDLVESTLVAPFNDLEAAQEIAARSRQELAAIILEPVPMNMGLIPPQPGFLEGLRKLCDETGALLIFDEVKTCGKFFGGASGRFGVRPDLMVMGKAIAGGFPLSAVGGKRVVMESIVPGVLAHAGTFNANPLSVTAAMVTLSKVMTKSALHRASRLGEELAGGYQDIIQDHRLEAKVQWLGLSGAVLFTDKEVKNWRDFLRCNIGQWWTYFIAMMNRGVIPEATGQDEQWTVSVQHTSEDVVRHLETFKEVAASLRNIQLRMPMVEAL
ncbi:MAG: aspartate aminotransferase family protein [Thaumarchaeota archaeon]|nr:aspartate aminotransferase family protein [Nitrososphaerota archaeon]